MNPDQKLLLEEIDKRFAVRIDRLECKLDSSTTASSSRLDALESAAKLFDEWRPNVDGVIDDLRGEVAKLSTLKLEVGKITKYYERSMVDGPSASPGVFAKVPLFKPASAPASPSVADLDTKPSLPTLHQPAAVPEAGNSSASVFVAAPRSPAGFAAQLPHGHRVESGNRDGAFGVVTTRIPPPGKGTFHHRPPFNYSLPSPRPPPPVPFAHPLPSPRPPPPPPIHHHTHRSHHWQSTHQGDTGAPPRPPYAQPFPHWDPVYHEPGGSHPGRLPKFDFPKFVGEHPKLWLNQAAHYFSFYHVESNLWIQAATMHFHGAAKRWLSSVEDQLETLSWSTFCCMLLACFGHATMNTKSSSVDFVLTATVVGGAQSMAASPGDKQSP